MKRISEWIKNVSSWSINAKIFVVVIIILLLIFVKQFYFIVNPWERWMIIRLWNIKNKIYEPWLHLKAPFVEHAKYMNIQTQKIEKHAESASKDLQIVNSTIAFNYSVVPSEVINIYKNIWDLDVVEFRIIEPAIQETVKATTALFTAEELITKRQEVSVQMKQILFDKMKKIWLNVSDINIIDFQFSEEFNKAIENKVKAEQEALAEKNKLEQVKYEAQQRIETSRWRWEAKVLEAKAQAESIRIKAESIKAQWWKEYLKLKRIETRDWKLPTTILWSSDSSVLINMSE